MKKSFLLFAAIILICSTAPAQNSKAARTKQIRAAYAVALQSSAPAEEPRAQNVIRAKVQHCFPGTGLQYWDVDIFHYGDFDDECSEYKAAPYFVRAKTNLYDCAGRKLLAEYLYDGEARPMFLFKTEANVFAETDILIEYRYYFYEDGSLCDFILKVKDRTTGQYLSEKNMPDLFESINGEDWKERLEDFEDYKRVTSALIDF